MEGKSVGMDEEMGATPSLGCRVQGLGSKKDCL